MYYLICLILGFVLDSSVSRPYYVDMVVRETYHDEHGEYRYDQLLLYKEHREPGGKTSNRICYWLMLEPDYPGAKRHPDNVILGSTPDDHHVFNIHIYDRAYTLKSRFYKHVTTRGELDLEHIDAIKYGKENRISPFVEKNELPGNSLYWKLLKKIWW